MDIVLLTTNTTHHLYYAWKLSERFDLQAIFLETQSPTPNFETEHPFEKQRESYEQDVLLANFSGSFATLADTREFVSVNELESVTALRALAPDVILVFGVGKLAKPVFQMASLACLNLHGGNPERYRGLDSHLWAIYHQDFDELVTSLHHIDAQLDTGDMVFQTHLKLKRDSRLHELRALNTQACVNLSLLALTSLNDIGWLPARTQSNRGRYYSFMPAALKDVCIKKFDLYVSKL